MPHEQRRRRGVSGRGPRQFQLVGPQLVRHRADGDSPVAVGARDQIARDQRHPADIKSFARDIQLPPHVRGRQGHGVGLRQGGDLFGQDHPRGSGRRQRQAASQLVLQDAPGDLVRENPERSKRQDRGNQRAHQQAREQSSGGRVPHRCLV